MKYRKMGKLGWEVSALGFGCMRLPTRFMLPVVNKNKAIKMIRRGIDLGINYVDTAYMYHLFAGEKIVGQALKDGYREKVKLVTKMPTMMANKEEDFEKFFNKQMEKLDVDHLDVYLFHHLSAEQLEKLKKYNWIKKMEKLKDEGLIDHFGFSFHDTLATFKEIMDYYDWEICQIQYNYMDTGIQAGTEGLEYAHEKGAAVVIMEPLRGGYLANPPAEAIKMMKNAPVERDPIDWAFQFLWDRPEVSVVLSGMSAMKHVEDNCKYADNSGINSLSQAEKAFLEDLANVYRKNILVPCTACKYCMPCPAGVNIPHNFGLLNNKSFNKGSINNRVMQFIVTRRYKQMAKNKEELRKKPKNGRALLCVECGQCIEKCPQGIDIPTELKKVNEVFENRGKIKELFPKE